MIWRNVGGMAAMVPPSIQAGLQLGISMMQLGFFLLHLDEDEEDIMDLTSSSYLMVSWKIRRMKKFVSTNCKRCTNPNVQQSVKEDSTGNYRMPKLMPI
jgi:hypothetical protein